MGVIFGRKGLISLLFLTALTLGVYWKAFSCGFVNFDDPSYVTDNPAVMSGICPTSLAYAWRTFDTGNWIPMTWLSLQLDSTLFGVIAPAYHRTNVFLHTLNVVLLYVALRRMTRADNCSLFVAALFAVHPLHVESVAWISERKDVLSTTFLLFAILAYERYASSPTWGRWCLVAGAMAIGLMAKSMLVTLPLLLLFLDWWPLRRYTDDGRYVQATFVRLFAEKLPLFFLSLIDGIITIAAQDSTPAFQTLTEVSATNRLGNAIASVGWYLWKTILPTHLCVYYKHPGNSLSWGLVLVSALTVCCISAYALRLRSQRPECLVGWCWFLISLSPVIGLLQVGSQAHADRYVYIPHIGLFFFIVWETNYWTERFRWGLQAKWILLAAILCAFSVRTVQQVSTWHDNKSLWEQALFVDSECSLALASMGTEMLDQNRLDEAEQFFERSLKLDETHLINVVSGLATIHEKRGDMESAAEYYRWVLRTMTPKSNSAKQRAKERLAAIQKHNPQKQTADTRLPKEGDSAMNLGLAAARQNDFTTALRYFESAVEANPQNASAHNNVGLALSQLKRLDEAEAAHVRAVEIAPINPDFRVNLGLILEARKPAEAIIQYREALRLRPGDIEAKRRLARLEREVKQ